MSKWQGDQFVLYDKAQCPFCWKVKLACEELGIPLRVLDYRQPENEEVWRELNPVGTVPVLVHNGLVINESSVIMEYLSDLSQLLLPAGIKERVKARLLHKYSDGTLGSGLREVIFEKRGKPQTDWDLERIKQGQEKFYQDLLFLEQTLDAKICFTPSYSIADCAITARLGLAEKYGVPIPADYPKLRKWFQQMKQRLNYESTKPH